MNAACHATLHAGVIGGSSIAFSSEVDTGSREEKRVKIHSVFKRSGSGSREENASKSIAFSSEVDPVRVKKTRQNKRTRASVPIWIGTESF
jgi:hypothetical protein